MNVRKVKVVIFDVDGTLYDQTKLRKKIFFEIVQYYLVRPWKLKDLFILRDFRNERELRANEEHIGFIENLQFEWCAKKGNYSVKRIRDVVNLWMFKRPNQFLKACAFAGINSFFDFLRDQGIKIAIYSDYHAQEKLEAMGLEADLVISSTDEYINRLKPNPKGLNYIAQCFNVEVSECLFIGDRDDLDAKCALNIQMPYLILPENPLLKEDFYIDLENKFKTILPLPSKVKEPILYPLNSQVNC